MPNHQIIINGQALFAKSALPIEGLKVEVWDVSSTYGLIGSTFTDKEGRFTFYFNSPIANQIESGTITPEYRTYKCNDLISNTTTKPNDEISISIDEKDYDTEVTDTSCASPVSYITVWGRVTHTSGVAVPDLLVNVYEKGYNVDTLIAQTSSGLNGDYSVKITTRSLGHSVVMAGRSIVVKVYDGEAKIASSDALYLSDSDKIQADLVIAEEGYTPLSQFESLMAKIEYILDGDTFENFSGKINFGTSDPVEEGDSLGHPIDETQKTSVYGNSNGKLDYVARAIGCELPELQKIVRSYQLSVECGVEHDLMHALMQASPVTENPVINMLETDVRRAVRSAINANQIPDHENEDIEDFVTAVKDYQIATAKEIPIVGEAYTIGTVLNKIFGGGEGGNTDTTQFLELYRVPYNDVDEFWYNYDQADPVKAEKAKRGLTLASITGFQPEMTGSLMGDTNGGMHPLAAWSESDWVDYITTVSNTAQTLCVPSSIIGDYDPTDEEDIAIIKALYAKKLRSIVQDKYPLTALNVTLQDSEEGPGLIQDGEIRAQAVSFIADNPNFDLRVSSIYDINAENQDVDVSSVQDFEDVQQAMAPMQRMLRLVGGNPAAAARLIADSLGSYAAIAATPADAFASTYASVLGGADAAYAAYGKAVAYSSAAKMNFTGLYQQNAQLQLNVFAWPYNPDPPISHADPNIKTLFGSTSYCACEQCLSVYSPAAYFTDIMNFLRTGLPGSPLPNVYSELIRRRPDLEHIDMTCKNTNTLMPYIDLVIELLEGIILKRFSQPGVSVPPSYQTSGTPKELAAHPEHVYKQFATISGIYTWSYLDFEDYVLAYNPLSYSSSNKNLTNVVYPFNLPFSLPAAETRTYLSHLGYSRYEMMKMFRPYDSASTISDFDIYCELLGITEDEGKIIAGTHTLSSSTWRFYGFSAASVTGLIDPADTAAPLLSGTWSTLLTDRLDLLIQQLKMPYKTFLQFLTTDFLNKPVSGVRKITVTSKDSTKPDTCDLTKLKLVFTGDATPAIFLGKLHRFVRLWNTNRMSVSDWDKMFTSLLVTTLNATEFGLIGKVLQFADKLRMKPTELAGWWYYMDIHQYVDYASELQSKQPSVYDSLYRNRAVLNLPLPEFHDIGAYDPTSIPGGNLPPCYNGFTSAIASANNIAETDLLLIIAYMGITDMVTHPVTLGELSNIYFFSTLCKQVGYTVSDLLKVLYLLKIDINPPVTAQIYIPTRLDDLTQILSAVDAINSSSLTLLEIDFLVENYTESGPVAPAPLNIQFFFEKLRNELQKFPIYTGPAVPTTDEDITAYNKLTNLIYQSLSKEFNVPSEWAATCVAPTVIAFLIDATFVSSMVALTPDEATLSPTLYPLYKLAYKLAYITRKFRLNSVEFQYFFQNPTVLNFNFLALPVTGLATHPLLGDLFLGLLQMSRWINLRDKLSLIEDQLVRLLKAAHDDLADVNASMTIWHSILNRDKWGDMLVELIGDPATIAYSTPAGLLNARFTIDFVPSNPASISKIWGMIGIMAGCLRTGLKPETLRAALLQGLTMSDSHQVLLAAKGKHTEDEWASIAKPLRDTLRKKQRDALVGFVVANPDPTNTSNVQKWRNENDLYAFLLIDIEMEACMKTSRIKQAICSVQLYVDRVLLGLEYRNGDVTNRITMPAKMQYQWDQWRFMYRVWEANRKVFLYPENWIEPELRDNKSVFFTEMEDKLFQSDVTKQRAEDALFEYLRKLQDVAKLEPMAVCEAKDPVTARIITHVVARTYTEPHKYYYRRQIYGEWTPWERMDIEVKGNHLSLIVWNNQLYLFWLTMKERAVPGRTPVVNYLMANNGLTRSKWFYHDLGRPNTESGVNDSSPVHIKQIEITAHWSEYKDSQWQEQQVGKEKMYLDLNPIINEYIKKMFPTGGVPTGTSIPSLPVGGNLLKYYECLTNGRSVGLAELVMSRIYLSTFTMNESFYKGVLLTINMSNEFFDEWEYGDNIHSFYFTKDRGVVVWEPWFGGRIPATARTAYKDNKCVNWYRIEQVNTPPTPNVLMEGLLVHNTVAQSTPRYCYPGEFMWSPLNVPKRNGGWYVLGKSPNGTFKVFGFSEITANGYNIMQKGFFYEDAKYCFFARPVQISGTSGTISLSSAAETAANYYFTGGGVNTVYGSYISVTSVYSTQQFYFQSFFHGRVNNFMWALSSGGVDGFMKIGTQDQTNILNFSAYQPTSLVYGARVPTDKVDFEFDSAYGNYNWELFFHMPLLIAKRLSDNQQFEDARKWYHYIFDPTCNVDAAGAISHSKQRFWRFRPFYDAAGAAIASVDDLLMQIHMGNADALNQLYVWMDNPFKPHIIARMRILAYMKNVVMCYMDNLIAWADKLYRQDTIETINQATNLYIVVANILGDRPQEVPKRLSTGPRTFSELAAAGLDAFSNAMVGIENYIDPNSGSYYVGGGAGGGKDDGHAMIKLFYYCLPNNPKLLGYWDIIANRLFNIRNCRNIDGQVRELPLFEPPIDPALLVRAAAAGIDASSVLDALSTPPMPYRFTVILQKANELCNDVKALGGALLSALEKKDAEELALLRSSHEIAVLESAKLMKQTMIDEAAANIEALNKSKDVAQARYAYYSSRPYKLPREIEHLALMDESQKHQHKASTLSAVASVLSIIPEFNIQAPFAIGPSFGGRELSAVFSALSTIQSQKASAKSAEASKALTEAGYERRRDDWVFQAESAQKDMAQIERQIITAQIHKSVAEKDVATQEIQIANAKDVDRYMHEKYTNIELYGWMVAQISSTYFQVYQFAYDVAKRAEKNLNFEVPWINTPGTGFIRFGYWDSLKKGLMSGEKMQYDLRKMEMAYLEANTRELEVTKHISLAFESPAQLLALRDSGMFSLTCTQDMFDFDYPGHYNRRVKSVSVSIPCVAGPYTTIAATLTQTGAQIEAPDGTLSAAFTSPSMIALSGAQNDSGMFELNYKDDRYLPFEGSGAICTWNLSMMDVETLRQFDYNTISDVIIHVKYTAQYDDTKRSTVTTDLNDRLNSIAGTAIELPRYFSLKHEFANAWFAFATAFASDTDAQLQATVESRMFPYFAQNKDIKILKWDIMLKPKSPLADTYKLQMVYEQSSTEHTLESGTLNAGGDYMSTLDLTPDAIINPDSNKLFKIRLINQSTIPDPTNVDMNDLLDDIYLVATYKLSIP